MAIYSIKNISASAVVWSSQTIQPNEAIDINYENLYDKTTDLGISQDAMNVSTLAQEDKILLCVDGVASTKEETLEFIRELHNKNNVLEIPTKFLPSKHSYNWEKDGDKIFHLENKTGFGTSEPSSIFHILDSNFPQIRVNNEGGGESGFRLKSFSDNNNDIHADIFLKHSSGNEVGSLGFRVPYTSERMTILSDGKIGIGDSNPTGAKVVIEENTNPQLQLKNSSNKWDFRVGDTGDLILKKDSTEKFRLKSDGSLSTSNGLLVTESPYFTDGIVDYNSDITHASFTGTNLSYSVSNSGVLDFYGYCYTSSLSNNSNYVLNTGNPLPVHLRPINNKYISAQCWSSNKTNGLLMIVSSATGLITLYTRDKGWSGDGTIFVPINTSYPIQG